MTNGLPNGPMLYAARGVASSSPHQPNGMGGPLGPAASRPPRHAPDQDHGREDLGRVKACRIGRDRSCFLTAPGMWLLAKRICLARLPTK
jgi:hypothetical protein